VIEKRRIGSERVTCTSGSSHYVDYGNIHDRTTDSFSLCVWFKTPTTPGANAAIIAKSSGLTAADPGYFVWYGSATDNIFASVADGASIASAATGAGAAAAYFDNAWHLIVMTVDRSGELIQLYMDGVALGAAADTTAVGSLTNAISLQAAAVNAGSFMTIGIGNVTVFDHALSSSDAWDFYVNGSDPGVWPGRRGLADHWLMNEGEGTTLYSDVSANTGTLMNGAAWVGPQTLTTSSWANIAGQSITWTPLWNMRALVTSSIGYERTGGAPATHMPLELGHYVESGPATRVDLGGAVVNSAVGDRGVAVFQSTFDVCAGQEVVIRARGRNLDEGSTVEDWEISRNSHTTLTATKR
jgi:hypothetical protein